MKKFAFKLQTALDLKLKAEDRKKEELVTATGIYQENLCKLAELKARLNEIQGVLRGKQERNVDVFEIGWYQDYIPVLNEHIEQQCLYTEESRLDMETIRFELIELMKERKILEKLRDRNYKEYMREFLREEQKQIDEMATTGFLHRDSAV